MNRTFWTVALATTALLLADRGTDGTGTMSPPPPTAVVTPTSTPVPVVTPAPFPSPVQVLAADPLRVRLDRLGLDLAVVPMGVADDGQMALPERLDEVGWYRFGPRPGEVGSAVLAGHVDSRRYGVGPLARLRDAAVGDDVVVTTTAAEQAFTVTEVRSISKAEVPLQEVFRREGVPVLRMLTCGGPYSPNAGYSDNVVLTAVPKAAP
jgi:Sortase domain